MKIQRLFRYLITYFAVIIIVSISKVKTQEQRVNNKECNENETKVQSLHEPVKSNGCSKPEFIEIKGEEDFTYCCDQHDSCYSMCGSSKEYCDHDFLTCMKKLCISNFKHNQDCDQAASVYGLGVQMFGHAGYKESQHQHCTCIAKKKVIDHYTTLIDNFYTKYVDNTSRKSGGHVLKHSKHAKNSGTKDNPVYENLYKIYYELHKKYDHAIEHVDSRVGKTPPKPKIFNEL